MDRVGDDAHELPARKSASAAQSLHRDTWRCTTTVCHRLRRVPALRSSSHVDIRKAQPSDARDMAALHRDRLPHGFFAALGLPYLAVYHRSFMASFNAVSLVACRDGQVVGLLAGAINAHAHQRLTIRQSGVRLASVGLVALLLRPRLAAQFLGTRGVRYLRGLAKALRPRGQSRSSGPPAGGGHGDVAVLTHIAVDEDAEGSGAGTALVEAFVNRVRASGAAQRIELVTLTDGGASAFYERLGWVGGAEYLRDGSLYRRYSLPLD